MIEKVIAFLSLAPANFMAVFSADVYTARLESPVADRSTTINFTLVANNAQFNGLVTTIILSVVGGRIAESLFRLSDESLSRTYNFGDSELQTDGATTSVSNSIIVRNNPTTPLTPDVYDIGIGGLVVGIVGGNGEVPLAQESSTGLIEVIESSSKLGTDQGVGSIPLLLQYKNECVAT